MAVYAVELEVLNTGTFHISADHPDEAEVLVSEMLDRNPTLEPPNGWKTNKPEITWVTNITPDGEPGSIPSNDELEDAFWAGYEQACRDFQHEAARREVVEQQIAELRSIDEQHLDLGITVESIEVLEQEAEEAAEAELIEV